jgi:hypothetical protein
MSYIIPNYFSSSYYFYYYHYPYYYYYPYFSYYSYYYYYYYYYYHSSTDSAPYDSSMRPTGSLSGFRRARPGPVLFASHMTQSISIS